MNQKKDFSTSEIIALVICALVGVVWLLGKMELITTNARTGVISWLAFVMLMVNGVTYRKKSKLIMVLCFTGAVICLVLGVMFILTLF